MSTHSDHSGRQGRAGKECMCLSHNIIKRKGFLRPLQGHKVSRCKIFLHWFIFSKNQKMVDSMAIDLRKFVSKVLSSAEENLKWKALKTGDIWCEKWKLITKTIMLSVHCERCWIYIASGWGTGRGFVEKWTLKHKGHMFYFKCNACSFKKRLKES